MEAPFKAALPRKNVTLETTHIWRQYSNLLKETDDKYGEIINKIHEKSFGSNSSHLQAWTTPQFLELFYHDS